MTASNNAARVCGRCGESIADYRPQARYCSDACRISVHRRRHRALANLMKAAALATDPDEAAAYLREAQGLALVR